MEQLRLLDALRARFGSDSAAARELGISRQAVSLLRKSNKADDSTICKACSLLGISPGPSLALHRSDLTDDPATCAACADIARQLSAADSTPGNNVPPESNSAPPNALTSPADTSPAPLYYVKSDAAKKQGDGDQHYNANIMAYGFHFEPSSNNSPDLFGQITVTAADVVAWVSTIPAFPPRTGSDRWAKYVADYNVLDKVARAKRDNRFSEILDRAPLATETEIAAAATALAGIAKKTAPAAASIPATAQTAPAPSVAATSAPPRLADIAVLRIPMASTTLTDAFVPSFYHPKAA